ncbi:hypothetical protein NUU61_003486 [Penicillium alfredii]|uniref:Uncharacterized protein n=1 Tax=Penicillium alfredii TaxID=1506179 RepID=A0A9W9KCI1_9EURO|nr:uncharacterized protein NUU61_003486 [Penicillium alfredii]KAJ5101264.1 hypothetical protein NUU61_003486 [Penicillium alfredii]
MANSVPADRNLLKEPSYPSNCLHFIRSYATDSTTQRINIPVCLNVIIVGAGLGGLATAIALARNHSVTIYEQANQLAEA